MSDMVIKFTIPTDDEGYYSLECQHCHGRFKTLASNIPKDQIFELFCPICGIPSDPNSFLTSDIMEHAMTLAENEFKKLLNGFSDNIENMFKGNKYIEVKKGKDLELETPKLLTEQTDLDEVFLRCCEKYIKLSTMDKISNVYCPFCGVN